MKLSIYKTYNCRWNCFDMRHTADICALLPSECLSEDVAVGSHVEVSLEVAPVLQSGLQCTMYSVQRTVYSVQSTMYSVQCTVYGVQCTVYSVPCKE